MKRYLFLISIFLISISYAEEYRIGHAGAKSSLLGEVESGCQQENQTISGITEELNLPSNNDSYFEYNMKKMLYYSAEMIDIIYADGAKLRIGITEPWTKKFDPKIENVDCQTSASDLIKLEIPGMGYRFIDRFILREIADHPQEDIIKYSTKVEFNQDSKSGKIVPSHINNLTAPHICKMLRDTEVKYVREWDAFAHGMVKILEKNEMIVNLLLFNPTSFGMSSAGRYRPVGWPGRVFANSKAIYTPMSNKAAQAALSGMRKNGGHAMSKAINKYGLIPNAGNHATKLEKFKEIATPILTSPFGKPFNWPTQGKLAATGYLKKMPVKGTQQWVFVQVAKEGPYAGKVLTLYVPKPHQLKAMFKKMMKKRIN